MVLTFSTRVLLLKDTLPLLPTLRGGWKAGISFALNAAVIARVAAFTPARLGAVLEITLAPLAP